MPPGLPMKTNTNWNHGFNCAGITEAVNKAKTILNAVENPFRDT